MNALFWMSLNSEQPQIPPTFVNVEDVAKSFIHAIENETPSGTEYILSGQNCTWKQVVDFVKKQYPALDVKLTPPFQQTLTVDTSAADKDLGTKWSTYEELVTSVLNQQLTLQGRL